MADSNHIHQVPNGEFTTLGIRSLVNPNMHYHVYNSRRTGDSLSGIGHVHDWEETITGPQLEFDD